jgi:hypothetical protein
MTSVLGRSSGNRPVDGPLSKATRAFMRTHGDGWKAVDCIFWLTSPQQPKIQVAGRWFFQGDGPKYASYASPDGMLVEFFVWGALPTEVAPVRLSLGVCQVVNATPPQFSRASDHGVQAPLHGSTHGTVVQIMSVTPQRRRKTDGQSAEHMQDVVRKKGLHLGNLKTARSSMLPVFGVLTTRCAHEARKVLGKLETSDDDYIHALDILEGPEWYVHHPWSVVNRLDADARARVVHILETTGITEDIEVEVSPGILLTAVRMPAMSDGDRMCAWRAAGQSRRSASIPIGMLYAPIVFLDATGSQAFSLYRRA